MHLMKKAYYKIWLFFLKFHYNVSAQCEKVEWKRDNNKVVGAVLSIWSRDSREKERDTGCDHFYLELNK